MVSRVGLLLAFMVLGTIVAREPSRASPVMTASSAAVKVGDVFTIPISIANTSSLTSFQFDLAFDPSIVEALGFTDVGTDFETAALSAGGSLTGITGFIDNPDGLLSGVADSMSGILGPGLAPSGVLVNIDFKALSSGLSVFALANAFLIDDEAPLSSANGDFLLQNGQVVAFPEPNTLLLLGLAVLGGLVCGRCLNTRGRPGI